MPQLVHIFERKTRKKHKCYPVDAVQNLKVLDRDGLPIYVASEEECEKSAAPMGDAPKVESQKPVAVKK